MERITLGEWLSREPFTLTLSSSFFGFFAHCGVAEAIYEAGLKPHRITGASAGALVGGALSSGLSPSEMKEILFRLKKEDFWDPSPGLGILRGKKFLNMLEKHFIPTFEKAKIPLEVAVLDLFSFRTTFLKNGPLPKTVVASCAVPVLFHPVRIGRRIYLDGGVFHKSGLNLAHPGDRTLSVFLQGDGPSDAYEWNRSLGKIGPAQKVLRLKKLPRLHYNALDKSELAYNEGYRRTKEALNTFLNGDILD
jgi:NTE family protein